MIFLGDLPHLAAASLLGLVEMAVTVFPIALASLTPICPSPPMPMMPTLLPPPSAWHTTQC